MRTTAPAMGRKTAITGLRLFLETKGFLVVSPAGSIRIALAKITTLQAPRMSESQKEKNPARGPEGPQPNPRRTASTVPIPARGRSARAQMISAFFMVRARHLLSTRPGRPDAERPGPSCDAQVVYLSQPALVMTSLCSSLYPSSHLANSGPVKKVGESTFLPRNSPSG